jgi:4-hydroxy-tetrahydrodipicolinate synthase
MLYNVPGRTGCNMDAATVGRLATIPTVVGLKEASGNIQQMAGILRATPPGFIVLSGGDGITLQLMAIGGRGIISVASNEIPAEMVQMVEAAERGDSASARAMHQRLLPLLLVNFVEGGVRRERTDRATVRGGERGRQGRGARGLRPIA